MLILAWSGNVDYFVNQLLHWLPVGRVLVRRLLQNRCRHAAGRLGTSLVPLGVGRQAVSRASRTAIERLKRRQRSKVNVPKRKPLREDALQGDVGVKSLP